MNLDQLKVFLTVSELGSPGQLRLTTRDFATDEAT